MDKKKIVPLTKIRWSILLEVHDDLSIFIQCIEKLAKSVDPKRTEIFFLGDQKNSLILNTFSSVCEKYKVPYNYADDKEHALSLALGRYIVLMTDHTVVSKNFLVRLSYCMENFDKESRTAIVAPVSNEIDPTLNITAQNIDEVQAALASKNLAPAYSLKLSLFCLMAKKEVLHPNYNTREEILAANYDGYLTISCNDAMVYHFKEEIDDRLGKHFLTEPKLGILYRIKVDDEYMRDIFVESIEKSANLTENIYVLDDNSKFKLSVFLKERCPDIWKKIKKYEKFSRPYNEKRDYNELIGWAEADGCNWIMTLEGDDILEDKAVDPHYFKRFLNTPNPEVFAYQMDHYYFYNSDKQWRIDSPWGKMADVHLARLFPNRRITKEGTVTSQFGYVPEVPEDAKRISSIRIKNYGYLKPEYRERKRAFFEKLNLKGYDFYHITETNGMHRYPWIESNSVSFYTPVKEGGSLLWSWLDKNSYFADQIVIGNDEEELPASDLEVLAGYENITIVPTSMKDDFASGRNKIIEKCDTDWVMQLDLDEEVENLAVLNRLMDTPKNECWMFSIVNLQKYGDPLITETIRLFKNNPGARYWGRLHETIDNAVRELGWKIGKSPVKLVHYGYILQNADQSFRKMQRYLSMNLKQMKENPMHGMAYYSVALHLLEDGLIDDAEKLLNICTFLMPAFPLGGIELAKVYLRKASKWTDAVMKGLPDKHALKQSFLPVQAKLTEICPRINIVAPGHALNYFNIHADEREWLKDHVRDIEKKIDERKAEILEKHKKQA